MVRFGIRLRDPKADARHQERVAEEREALREKKRAREEERAAGPRVPTGTVNMNTLGMKLMMHIDPLADPDVHVPLGNSLHEVVLKQTEPVIYMKPDGISGYVVLTPPPPKFELGLTIRLLIVRGPKPYRRGVASITLGEHGDSTDVQLPTAWIETECGGELIYPYEQEIAAYDARRATL